MYYVVTEYELPVIGHEERKLITIGNKTAFTDMYDYHPLYVGDKTLIIPEEELKEFIKDGFATKEDAESADELKEAIADFIGLFFCGDFEIMSETELLQKYKALK